MRVTRVEMQSTSTTAIGSGDCTVTFHLRDTEANGDAPMSLLPSDVHNGIAAWLDASVDDTE